MATEGQQHPIRIYLIIWFWLFVLSALSYMVDIMQFQGLLRWTLILTFMFLKAGLIIAVFMHMKWERFALRYAILAPPIALAVLVALMALESEYVFGNRLNFLSGPA